MEWAADERDSHAAVSESHPDGSKHDAGFRINGKTALTTVCGIVHGQNAEIVGTAAFRICSKTRRVRRVKMEFSHTG